MTADRTGAPAPRPPTLIRCGGCDATWTAVGTCHCGAADCHRTFASIGLFDRHRSAVGEHGRCLNPADLDGFAFRGGMWRSPEMSEVEKLAAFGGRSQRGGAA